MVPLGTSHDVSALSATHGATDYLSVLAGLDQPSRTGTARRHRDHGRPDFTIERADPAAGAGTDADGLRAYRTLRRAIFVDAQGLFADHDRDDVDDDPRTVVLIARDRHGTVLGGVRLAPATTVDIGWWRGSRLVVAAPTRGGPATGADPRRRTRLGGPAGVGAALVRAACAHAEAVGALRFDATVQADKERFFARLGWARVGDAAIAGRPHAEMRWPIGRIGALAAATKSPLGALLAGLLPSGGGFVGDDGAPVPGSDLVAACDAVLPSMVERDPEWAGWCGALVNMNDLAAMGARPVGLLDALAAPDAALAARVLSGLRAASDAYGVPLLGGHTQLGVPAALAVTALGHAPRPVPAGGGRPGDDVSLIADLGGSWRPGYSGRQWDSTSSRTGEELRRMVGVLAGAPRAAAKDVSMAGLVGTLGMLAEASGCSAELDVAAIPRPAGVSAGDWLTCFPGFALLVADRPGRPAPIVEPATTARCGRLHSGAGVRLRWPDGASTVAIPGPVTGLGPA
jgi:putative N-acetyltransferase (TIGR04045 family)